jgi:hypothetical protein
MITGSHSNSNQTEPSQILFDSVTVIGAITLQPVDVRHEPLTWHFYLFKKTNGLELPYTSLNLNHPH